MISEHPKVPLTTWGEYTRFILETNHDEGMFGGPNGESQQRVHWILGLRLDRAFLANTANCPQSLSVFLLPQILLGEDDYAAIYATSMKN
jgi:hypothetical protein